MGGPGMGAPMGGAPAAGGNKTMRYVGIGCGVLLLISCLCSAGSYACNMLAAGAASSLPTAGPGVAEPTTGGGGGSVCANAVACCQAYMAQMPGAAGTVDCNIYNAAGMEAGCQSAIDGYRSGLSAMGQAVPAACQ